MSQPAYVLTRDGDTVHLRTCPDNTRGTSTYPWMWAVGKQLAEVRSHAAELRIAACPTCAPFGGAS